jgi:hypothetical protein
MNKIGAGRKMLTTIGQMRQADLADAQHLLSPCSSPLFFLEENFFYDYGLRILLRSDRTRLLEPLKGPYIRFL